MAVAQRARLVAAGSHGRVRCRLLRPGLHRGRETSRELRKHEVEVASRQSLLAYSGKMFAPGGEAMTRPFWADICFYDVGNELQCHREKREISTFVAVVHCNSRRGNELMPCRTRGLAHAKSEL